MNSEISDAGHCLTLRRIRKILDGEITCGEQFFDCTVNSACGRYHIGDALAFTRHVSVLLKCLTNHKHVNIIGVASMLDLAGVIIAGGIDPDLITIEKAIEQSIPLYITDMTLYELTGRMWESGIQSC